MSGANIPDFETHYWAMENVHASDALARAVKDCIPLFDYLGESEKERLNTALNKISAEASRLLQRFPNSAHGLPPRK